MNLFFQQDIFCVEIIHEGFDSGLVAPPGWVIVAGGTYTSASGSGAAIPSIKLSATGQYIETCEFANASEVSFFMKGYSVDSLSALIILYEVNAIWYRLDSISQISSSKKTMVLPLPDSTRKLRFMYFKSSGNIAFDDLIVSGTGNDTLPPVFNKIPEIIEPSDTSVEFMVSINKPGYVYCIITPDGCPFPSDSAFLNFSLYDYKCLKFAKRYNVFSKLDTIVYIDGLGPGTKYNSYWLVSSVNNDVSIDGAKASHDFLSPKIFHDLFFSEIIKGSGNNKAIEIFNPTDDTISLENYRISSSTNGGGWNTTFYKFPDGATIAPLDVFVLLKANADTSVVDFDVADDSTNASVLGFTGNDARAMQKLDLSDNTWKFIDIFGYPDSSVNFTVAGIAGAAASHTMIRKSYVKHGNTNWPSSAGTNTEDSEWIIYGQNDFSNLGKHTMFQDSILIFDTVYFECQEKPALIDCLKQQIFFTVHSESDISDLSLKYSLPDGISINPNPSTLSDFTTPVKFVLTDKNHSISTEWTVFTIIDEAPEITEIFYNNYPPLIKITFNETVAVDSAPSKGHDIPAVRIYSGKKTMVPFNRVFEDNNKVLKLFPEISVDDTLYTVLIDSVVDLYYNKMPAYEWSFKITNNNNLINNDIDHDFKVWPNPASGMLNINLPTDFNSSKINVKLITTNGKIFAPFIKENEHKIQLILSNVKSGMYFLTIENYTKILSSVIFVK